MKALGLWALLSCGALLIGALATPWWSPDYFHDTVATYGAGGFEAARVAEFLAYKKWSTFVSGALAAAGALAGLFMLLEYRAGLRAWRVVCALALLGTAVRWLWFGAGPADVAGWAAYWCAMGLWGELCARRTPPASAL